MEKMHDDESKTEEPVGQPEDDTQHSTVILNGSFITEAIFPKHPSLHYDDIEVSACLPDTVLSTELDDIVVVDSDDDDGDDVVVVQQAAVLTDHSHNLAEHTPSGDDEIVDYQCSSLGQAGHCHREQAKRTNDDVGLLKKDDADQNSSDDSSKEQNVEKSQSCEQVIDPSLATADTKNTKVSRPDVVAEKFGEQSAFCHNIINGNESGISIYNKDTTTNDITQANNDVSLKSPADKPHAGNNSSQVVEHRSHSHPVQIVTALDVEKEPEAVTGQHAELTQCDVNALFGITTSDGNVIVNEQTITLLNSIPATNFILDENGSIYAIQTTSAEDDSTASPALDVSVNSIIPTEEPKSATTSNVPAQKHMEGEKPSLPQTKDFLAQTVPRDVIPVVPPASNVKVTSPPVEATTVLPDVTTKEQGHRKKKRKHGGGWPKGKKRKKKELVQFKISPPRTAYLLFAITRRREINDEKKGYTFAEVTVMMGKEWTMLSPGVKEEYNKRADEDKARFIKELGEYQKTEEYQELLDRKRREREVAEGIPAEENLGYIDEEFTLFCHICDQRFSNNHNRQEHLAGKQHLTRLQAELAKQREPEPEEEPAEKEAEPPDTSQCCVHCVNRVTDVSLDVSLDINTHIETFIYKHSQREAELQMLRSNLKTLRDINSQLSKELISLQEAEIKLRQDLQNMKQWSLQLTGSIDNLKMVPTLFGVINF